MNQLVCKEVSDGFLPVYIECKATDIFPMACLGTSRHRIWEIGAIRSVIVRRLKRPVVRVPRAAPVIRTSNQTSFPKSQR